MNLRKEGQLKTIRRANIGQDELAKKLGISRQALQRHLNKLRNQGLIHTGFGFIDVAEPNKEPETITITINLADYLKRKNGEQVLPEG